MFKANSNSNYRRNSNNNLRGSSKGRKSKSSPFSKFRLVVIVVSSIIIASVVGVSAFNLASSKSPETVSCTVTSKERVTQVNGGNSSTQMIVNTKECGTLEIGNTFVSGNWSPNETYSALVEGDVYLFEVYGLKIDALNLYKQIKSVK